MQSDVGVLEARVERLDDASVDFDAFRERPLDASTLQCLRAMHDVEFHTVCYLRDLLVTPAHQNPEITAFLTFWAYEEYWHGAAISRVLDAHEETCGPQRVSALRRSLRWTDRLRPLGMQAASLVGDDIVAVQMTWGAVNEQTTQAAYAQLATRSDHPVLADLLHRIMRQEGRHLAFYTQQAKSRLASSRRARTVTRWALQHFWRPVGSGILAQGEIDFLCHHLFGDADGLAQLDRIDRHIERLPGMNGLNLMSGIPTGRCIEAG